MIVNRRRAKSGVFSAFDALANQKVLHCRILLLYDAAPSSFIVFLYLTLSNKRYTNKRLFVTCLCEKYRRSNAFERPNKCIRCFKQNTLCAIKKSSTESDTLEWWENSRPQRLAFIPLHTVRMQRAYKSSIPCLFLHVFRYVYLYQLRQ